MPTAPTMQLDLSHLQPPSTLALELGLAEIEQTADYQAAQAMYQRLWQHIQPDEPIPADPVLLKQKALEQPTQQTDRRRGITLIARPDNSASTVFQNIIKALTPLVPEQYIYPCSDLHHTIMSIVSASDQYQSNPEQQQNIIMAIQPILANTPPLKLIYRGLAITQQGLLLQGYPADAHLGQLRQQLRTALSRANMGQHLETRYPAVAAHSTLIRFQHPITNPSDLINALKPHQSTLFCQSTIQNLQLVENDWYMRKATTTELQSYPLK